MTSAKEEYAMLIGGDGFFLKATLLRNLKKGMEVDRDEDFDPELLVLNYTYNDDEIALANDTEYHLETRLKASDGFQADRFCVNELHYPVQLPLGGLKQSGVGKGCSCYCLEVSLDFKRVSIPAGKWSPVVWVPDLNEAITHQMFFQITF